MNPLPAQNLFSISEFFITRTFDEPRTLVWKAWTDPQHIQQWRGRRVSPGHPAK